MKITKQQLRTIIRVAKVKILSEQNKVGGDFPRDAFNPGQAPLEITAPGVSREQVSDHWPNVTYLGKDVMDLMYDDQVIQAAEDRLEELTGENFEGQENYLAWDPETDEFVMGFDVFLEHGMESGIVSLSPEGRVLNVSSASPGMYGSGNSGRNRIKKMYPNILELRLD